MELKIITEQTILGKHFTIYGTIENPLFLAKDVAEWIEHSDASKMVRYVDEEEKVKNIVRTLGGNQEMMFLTEDGLYEVLMQSRKPIAKQFKKEVKIILKQIRQTGGYIPIAKDDDEKTIMAKGYMVAMKTIEVKDKLIKQLQPKADEYDTFINSKGYISLNKTAKALKVGRNKMMAFLRHWSILFIDGQDNLPYQKYVSAGYFTIDCHVGRDGKVHATTRVSPKGVSFIHKLYLKYAPSIERTVA